MWKSCFPCFVALLCACAPPQAQTAAPQTPVAAAPAPASTPGELPQVDLRNFQRIYYRSQPGELSGRCVGEVRPNRASITGGIAVAALKSTEASERLDREIADIRSFIEQNHGELQLLERVRNVKTLPQGMDGRDPLFELVQRLIVVFPADAPSDHILQRLVELGMDRFGDNVTDNRFGQRAGVIHFRIGDFDAKMQEMQRLCTAEAWKKACASEAPPAACASGRAPDLQLQSFRVQSDEKLLTPENGVNYWSLNYAPSLPLPKPPELLGNVTVHLSGTISLTYRKEEKP
jgi:hypothetical protein